MTPRFRLWLTGLSAFLLLPLATFARTNVLLTIDTESYTNGNPKMQIWGEIDQSGERWGITKIMDIAEQNHGKATFYLNVYESARHGVGPIRDAAVEAIRRGHDVQLHTHPVVPFEVDKMSNADPATQEHILRYGAQLLREWTGEEVIAHRAGAFRANMDTIRALKTVGLSVDSSLAIPFRTPISEAMGNQNELVNLDGVLEIPLTFYTPIKLASFRLRRVVDIESSSFSEIREVLDQAATAKLCSVTILMHSFSLSRDGVPDPRMAERLSQVMAYVHGHPDLVAITTSAFYEKIRNGGDCNSDGGFVPHTGFLLTYLGALEGFDRSIANKIIVIGAPAGLALFLFIPIIVLRRARGRSCERASNQP